MGCRIRTERKNTVLGLLGVAWENAGRRKVSLVLYRRATLCRGVAGSMAFPRQFQKGWDGDVSTTRAAEDSAKKSWQPGS